jgi:CRISPR/Cas system-associated exonuclease Cas4 (RecB family)
MPPDKYTATWVSHTSISDFLTCPRAYYLKNIYKNPKTGNKMQIISPPLALGQVVHEIIESLSEIEVKKRFIEPLRLTLDKLWPNISGEKGGFLNKKIEAEYKNRAETMLSRITTNPGPLTKLAVKINMDLPYYWLSEDEEIILCGKIDWLEYIEDIDSVHIIDFKTGRSNEKKDSLQLPIYYLLAKNCQKRDVIKSSYWYLDRDEGMVENKLPDYQSSSLKLLEIARKIKVARKLNHFNCPLKTGCYACLPFENVLKGKAKLVGKNSFGQDIYIDTDLDTPNREGTIL